MTWRAMNRILGLDFGRARIGVAISDELQSLSHPLETIPADNQAIPRLAKIIREKKVDHVVVGTACDPADALQHLARSRPRS